VLTRLCGCDKLLQSLSVELAQLQMDKVGNNKNTHLKLFLIINCKKHIVTGLRVKRKRFFIVLQDSVQSALEVSRLQLEELKGLGPRAQEEALTQKALLQEELVTIRARVCDVSLVCNKQRGHGTIMK